MCGICGIATPRAGTAVDTAALERMNVALGHRGPDDSGTWIGGHAGLAMRRLRVIDLEGGAQPMLNEDGTVVVVFNGEIYNFQELRADLEKRGWTFRTKSDTEVVLRAFETYGDEALHRFNGMFALAVYDTRTGRLVLARDRIGIKPLFYTVCDGRLAFASELDALYRSGMVRGVLDGAALDAYFEFLYVPAPDTIFEGVCKLRPGEKLVFEGGAVHTEPYWRLTYHPDLTWTLDDAADAFTELLTDSVRLRRVSDVPLGAFLSGGIDSSTVVALLSTMSTSPVKTFTIGFDDTHVDELAHARAAAEAFGTDHTETILQPDMTAVAAELTRHFGEPFADSSALPTWLVAKVARRDVTVALSGDGGDELFAGYTWTHRALLVNRYRAVPATLRRAAHMALHMAPASRCTAKWRRFSGDSFLPPHEAFRRRVTCFGPESRRALYRRDLAGRLGQRAVDRFREHAEAARGLSDADRMLYQDTAMYLPDDILTKVDRMTMANSLEARVPFLDHRIVEFASSVPFHLKYNGRTSKRVVKRALRRVLPKTLLQQRKQGFSIPIQRWFRRELRDHFREAVLGNDARCRAFLNMRTVAALLDAHLARHEDHGHRLWAILMFEHWLRYIDTVPHVTVA